MPDGQTILFAEQHPDTQEDLSLLDLATTPRKAKTLLRTQFKEDTPELSPDGKWAAYISNESGRFEIFVRPSSGSFDQWQISTNGGAQPRWRRDGRELVYVTPDGNVMSVAIESQPVFRPGAPKVLFKLPAMPDRDTPIFEDLTPDGQRLLLNLPATQRSSVAFHTVQHWTSLLADAAH
jgi:Tol biopolymer transport system component